MGRGKSAESPLTDSAEKSHRRNALMAATLAMVLLLGTAVPTRFDRDALAGVTIAWFTATGGDGKVLVEWETASEIRLVGFNLWRDTSETGAYTKLNDSLIPSQAIGSVTGAYYSYTDADVINGTTYYYKLESVSADGFSEFHGPISATPGDEPVATPTSTATPTPTPTVTPAHQVYLPLLKKGLAQRTRLSVAKPRFRCPAVVLRDWPTHHGVARGVQLREIRAGSSLAANRYATPEEPTVAQFAQAW